MMPYDLPRFLAYLHHLSGGIRTDPMHPGIRAGKGEQRYTKIIGIANSRNAKFHEPLPPPWNEFPIAVFIQHSHPLVKTDILPVRRTVTVKFMLFMLLP
jgi:hypothetical protein